MQHHAQWLVAERRQTPKKRSAPEAAISPAAQAAHGRHHLTLLRLLTCSYKVVQVLSSCDVQRSGKAPADLMLASASR